MEDSKTKSWAALVAPESYKSASSTKMSCNNSPRVAERGSLKDNRPQPSAVNDAPSRAGNTATRQSQRRRKAKQNDKVHENGRSGAKSPLRQQPIKEKEQKKKQPALFSAPPANAWNKAEETKVIIGKTHNFSETMNEEVFESVRNMGIGEGETSRDHSIVSDDADNHEDPSEQSENALSSLSKSFEDIQYGAEYRVVPKGIDNPGNICFASSVIQALLACPSFCQIFYTLRRAAPSINSKTYPVLKSMSVLAREFRFEKVQDEQVADLKDGHNSQSDSINVGVVTNLIHESFRIRYKGADKKRQVEQEDAHEFLHSLLDAMHQEMLALQQGLHPDGGTVRNGILAQDDSSNDADGWLTKSGKRAVKQQVIRPEVSSNNTLITELFEGMQSTSVSSRGNPPSVTMHPFLIVEIPLFDPTVDSLGGALDSLTATEVLSGYRPRGQDVPCDANKSERFHKLPPVLIFHLMRFQFTGSTEKLNKKIRFEGTLNIKSSWLTSGSKDRQAAYKLVSTISHHGQSIARGHFTAHGLQHGNVWLHFNDEHIYKVREENVLHDSPYLLVYHKI